MTMSQSSSTANNKTTLSLLALILATAACHQAEAFAPSSTASLAAARSSSRDRLRPLFVVADPPGREEEKEKQKGDGNNDGNDDDAWIATSNGGFLPRIRGIFGKKGDSNGTPPTPSAAAATAASPAAPSTKTNTNVPTEVLTIQEYKAVVADEKNQMVCVRFYAPWCKACKAVQQPFRKLCRENPSVKFVEVPLTKENAFLHEGLGIPSLPYGHIYHPTAGLVEERKIKKKEFDEFKQILDTYVQGGCQVEYPNDDDCEVCRQK